MQARLVEWTDLAPGVRNFVFEAVSVAKFEFTPGQFVSFSDTVNGKVITRAYSIASPFIASGPADDNRFELCLNIVEDGAFTPHLFGLSPGAVLQMPPPLGTFGLPSPRRDAVLIATGTGIAPFRSMLKTYLDGESPAFTLLFGVRYESHLLYRDEFEGLARRFWHFRFWPTLTRPGPEWTGRTGRVQAHLEEALGGRRDLDVLMCGLKPMVDDVRRILKEMGFDRKQIRYEKYD